MIAGRPLLGAHIEGPATLWLARMAATTVADTLRYFRSTGQREVADSIERAFAELREAARQWQSASQAGISADGSAEAVAAEMVPSSKHGALLTTEAVAARLGVTPRRVRQLLADGSLSGTRVAGQWLVERASVDEHTARAELSA